MDDYTYSDSNFAFDLDSLVSSSTDGDMPDSSGIPEGENIQDNILPGSFYTINTSDGTDYTVYLEEIDSNLSDLVSYLSDLKTGFYAFIILFIGYISIQLLRRVFDIFI